MSSSPPYTNLIDKYMVSMGNFSLCTLFFKNGAPHTIVKWCTTELACLHKHIVHKYFTKLYQTLDEVEKCERNGKRRVNDCDIIV